MDDAKAEVLAFNKFPKPPWQKIWSTHPLERIQETKRRSRDVGTLPNPAAGIRLEVGAILAGMHDQWQTGERR